MNWLLIPLFVQVAMTFVLLYWMGFSRVKSISSGQVKMKDIALGQNVWPERIQRISNCFHNQLETPILFYAGIILCLHLQIHSVALNILAWIFIICRIGHAYVEIKTNYVPTRFRWFLFGTTTLLCFWISLAAFILLKS